ncbi:peroxiredoxin [Angustibacter peucedani]
MSETAPAEVVLTVGEPAPDLTLRDQHGEEVTLSSFRGERAVLLVFYPFAWSGTCTGELDEISQHLEDFQNDRVQVMAVSCDTMQTLRAWADAQGYDFPLLSDFWPHGAAANAYGVFFAEAGCATRGTFLVDDAGVLRWSVVHGMGEARDPHAYREAIAAL